MTAQNGALVLIKVGDGGSPETFTTIGGLRTSAIRLNNQILNATTLESGAWRQLAGSGISAMSISGNGMFTDAASEGTVRGYAFAASVNNYQFFFANGDYVTGAFQVTAYERSGDINAEETFALTLESAGSITFTS